MVDRMTCSSAFGFSMKIWMLSPCIMCAQYIGGCSVHQRDIMVHMGDTMSTLGGVQYFGGIPWVHRGTMIHMGELIDKSLWLILKTPMYWTFSNVLMVSPCSEYLRCTEHTLYRVALLLSDWFAGATRRRTLRKLCYTRMAQYSLWFISLYHVIPDSS